jgi:hypothetical protein
MFLQRIVVALLDITALESIVRGFVSNNFHMISNDKAHRAAEGGSGGAQS